MAFEELKQRQSVMWGSAPFEDYVHWLADMHDDLVRRLEPKPGERWLDLATGTGAVACRAARAGAKVTAIDIAPPMVEKARRKAEDEGLDIRFDLGDIEYLPYEDACFDVLVSAFGFVFAPDHANVAAELARVSCRGARTRSPSRYVS